MPTTIAVLYSGGLDSAILVAHQLALGHRVRPLFVDCRLHWQQVELAYARRFLDALDAPRLEELVVLSMPVDDLYVDHWSVTGRDVPSHADPDEAVYLPGRNPLLLVKACVWCHLNGISSLALGALGTNPFADASDAFFADFQSAMERALGARIELVRPFAGYDKRQVMELGRKAPLEWTFSCIAPVDSLHCGRCNKCAERQHAFHDAEMPDPTRYATPHASEN